MVSTRWRLRTNRLQRGFRGLRRSIHLFRLRYGRRRPRKCAELRSDSHAGARINRCSSIKPSASRTARAWRLTKMFARLVLITLAAENGRGLADMISIGSPASGKAFEESARFVQVQRRPVGVDERAIQSVRFCCFVQCCPLPVTSSLEIVVCREPYRGGSTLVNEGIAVAGSRVFPIPLVENVVCIHVECQPAIFTLGA